MAIVPFPDINYWNPTNGVYTNPATAELVLPDQKCCSDLRYPCAWQKELLTITVEGNPGPCLFSWCKLQRSLDSLAASNTISANADAPFTPALTAAEITALQETARLVNCPTCQ